jgi:glycosyltransferase involved in cell wall biosynthesis
MLFPIDWPEPFGLVMIEALACGTPVIAFSNGSVPEIVEDGVTGFVVQTVEEAVLAVRRVGWLDRATCRRAFEQRFDVTRMTRDYLAVYGRLVHDSLQCAETSHRGPELKQLPAWPGWGKTVRSRALLGALPAAE